MLPWLLLGVLCVCSSPVAATAIGEVSYFVGTSTVCPENFIESGVYFSSTTYPELAARVGCPSPNACNTPSLHGYFLRGWGQSQSIDVGRSIWTSQADQFETHWHSVVDPGHGHGIPVYNNTAGGYWGYNRLYNAVTTLYTTAVTNNSNTGVYVTGPNSGSYGSETRPDNYSALVCIRAKDEVGTSSGTVGGYPMGIFGEFTAGDLSFWLGVIVAAFTIYGFKAGQK